LVQADEEATMKRLAILTVAASALMIGDTGAQYYGDACLMFEHAGFGGEVLPMGPDDQVSFQAGQFWNDRVSSVRVARGCSLVVYEHTRMEGDSAELPRRIPNLGKDWNDRISSAECFCDY
jgi:hypothetical protein